MGLDVSLGRVVPVCQTLARGQDRENRFVPQGRAGTHIRSMSPDRHNCHNR
jgi:hypothetical protein